MYLLAADAPAAVMGVGRSCTGRVPASLCSSSGAIGTGAAGPSSVTVCRRVAQLLVQL